MWEAVETETEKARVAKAEGRRKERKMEVRKVAEEWEIWNKREEAVKLEEEARKLVPERFHKWIHVFGKKASKQMLTRKL